MLVSELESLLRLLKYRESLALEKTGETSPESRLAGYLSGLMAGIQISIHELEKILGESL